MDNEEHTYCAKCDAWIKGNGKFVLCDLCKRELATEHNAEDGYEEARQKENEDTNL